MLHLVLLSLCPWTLGAAAAPPCLPQDSPAASDRMDLGFEDGRIGQGIEGWFSPMPGWRATLEEGEAAAGRRALALRREDGGEAAVGNVMHFVPAERFRGRRVRLRAKIRVSGDADGRAQMWLRVDRAEGKPGGLDNMGDRPVRAGGSWSPATIELDVADDAERLALGVLAFGDVAVLVDELALESVGEARPLQRASAPAPLAPRALANLVAATRLLNYLRFFHPSDEVVRIEAWGHAAGAVLTAVEDAGDAADLAARLTKAFAPLAPTLLVWAGTAADAPDLPAIPAGASARRHWQHRGAGRVAQAAASIYRSRVVRRTIASDEDPSEHAECFLVLDLGGGVSCRLPWRVYADDSGTLPRAVADPAAASWSDPSALPKLTADNRATRLAAVALCWGVLQHFYPYFDVVATDWDAALADALQRAATDADERAFLRTLSTLVAQLHDGHGNVFHPSVTLGFPLPLTLGWSGTELVVAGKSARGAGAVAVGDVVVAIDGKTVADCYADAGARISAATEGWRRVVAQRELALSATFPPRATLRLRRPDGEEYETTIEGAGRHESRSAAPPRPTDGAELAPDIVYFNLDGAESAALRKCLPALAAAKGIVFDLRGYPGSAAVELIQHLIDDEAKSAQWHVPIVTRPDRDGWTWDSSGRWQLRPAEPRLRAQVAFLTDGRAISYAESIMGIVEHYRLGEIVGATTAGTNGNINPFELPGGYNVVFTGMKVLKHDGSQHHGVGIAPTVAVEPTAQGIAAGRDEVLERAVEVVKAKVAAGR